MAVGFASYEIARSGLSVNERGLNVTGHNISNVNTPGYVRQQAIIAASTYNTEVGKYGLYQTGTGAQVEQVRQIRHTFLDSIYRQENTSLGYWESRGKTFQDIEAIMGEPMSSGLQNVMNQFWDSWQELSKEPDSLTVRALVRQRGEALVHQINHVGGQLDKLQSDLNSEVRVRIDEVNQITSRVAKLNMEILKAEATRDSANDYRDERNSLIDRLSKLVDIDVNEMQDGELTIAVGGYLLVEGITSRGLSTDQISTQGVFTIPKLEGTNIEVPIKSGIIKGLMESRGTVSAGKESPENGAPYAKVDITFVIDNSASNAANLAKIKSNILNYVSELNNPGVDYNIRLVTYGASASYNNTIYDKNNFASFVSDVNSIPVLADTSNNFGGAGGVIPTLSSISNFRDNANKYAIVFTGESMDGNETTVSDPSTFVNALTNMGIKTSVVTNQNYYYNGDSASEKGWDSIANVTGGKLYDINSTDFKDLITTIARDNVNDGISLVKPTENILPELRKRLNALINVMAREINNLHKQGKTLNGSNGEDFFTTTNSTFPLSMGNIKLNDNLSDLNNIVSSATGDSGDNTIALQMAQLRHKSVMSEAGGILSIDDYYRSTVLSVGNGGADAIRIADNQSKLVESADMKRQSITGVSMDEEMTMMMKFKFAYNASSRTLNTIDEMIETIINRMGLAGR
ncbi:MAG: flagellar hook-associated protein FlgK [Clostridia bacterium]|nr:flagellar hook-associated protein FlgK [Clostridia bacterium]